VASLPISWALE